MSHLSIVPSVINDAEVAKSIYSLPKKPILLAVAKKFHSYLCKSQ